MTIYKYVGLAYLAIINFVTLIFYIKEAEKPSKRLSALALILLPVFGGAFGACIGNFFCNTEYKELRGWLHKFLAFLPPTMCILQFILIIAMFGIENVVTFVWNYALTKIGWIGAYLLIINIISFILVIIRKSSYYIAPNGNFLIPDLILIPLLIIGGATGGVIAKVLFNFKEDWSCNSAMEIQNFVYNIGMFIISAIHIGLCIYFFT